MRFVAVLVSAVLLAGCKAGDGEKCAKPDDCASGLTCIPGVFRCADPAPDRFDEASMRLNQAASAITMFKVRVGRLPDRLDDLVSAGIVRADSLISPWGHPLVYEVTGDTFTICDPLEDGTVGAGGASDVGDLCLP